MSAEKQKTILLVEDEAIIAMAEKMTLDKFGYNVIIAGSGEEAVATVAQTPAIDLILMDIDLGKGMDGTEAAEIILQHRDIPIVFLSSHTEAEIVARTEKITAYGFIVKNSSATVFQALIKMVFKLSESKSREKKNENRGDVDFEALQEREARLKKTQAMAHLGSWELDVSTGKLVWSDEVYHIFGLQPQEFPATYQAFLDSVHPEDRAAVHAAYSNSIRDDTDSYEIEHRVVRKLANEIRYVFEKCEHMRDASGRIVRSLGMVHDISERKLAEEEIKKQLLEKEVLLKEAYHRIKNNIASISGLISMKMQSVAHPEALAVLQDTVGRVNSMQLLYNKLLLSNEFKDVSVKNYVESLIAAIVTLFSVPDKVSIDKRIGDFRLDSKKIFPLGLVINELITNSLKYAFNNQDSGQIQVSLSHTDGKVFLIIQDNGVGLPEGFSMEHSTGFGLMLVKMLSQQLAGSFSMEKQAGTRCVVVFEING